jgi:hypothetical protein
MGSKSVKETLRCIGMLIPVFLMVGCPAFANKPNLIPEGYSILLEKVVSSEKKRKVIREEAAKLDYAITVAVEPSNTDFKVLWTKDGERIWSEPFWTKVRWWRFALFEQSAPGDALCYNEWTEADADKDPTEWSCTIQNVSNYIGKPLLGTLDYTFEKKKPEPDEVTPGVARLYYLVLK